jgi:hypothetical protein
MSGKYGRPGSDDLDGRARWVVGWTWPMQPHEESQMYPTAIRARRDPLPDRPSPNGTEVVRRGRMPRESLDTNVRLRGRDRRAARRLRPDEPAVRVTAATDSRPVDPDTVLEQASLRSGLSPTRIVGIEDGDGLLIFADAIPLAEAYGQSLYELSAQFERAMRERRVHV